MGRAEEALIEGIRNRFPAFTRGLGIGDDAAILESADSVVLTTDMLVEDVDFTSATPLRFVAEKSLTANLSDLAAMGSRPNSFLLALGIPRPRLEEMDAFLDALAAQASRYGVDLIGGDLSAADKLTISITALGTLSPGNSGLRRSGANAGDRIYLSRPVGASAAGLQLLRNGWTVSEDGSVTSPPGISGAFGYTQKEFAASVIRRHVSPEPETELGIRLSGAGKITSCIDISDGLSSDLHHLCDASGWGALIEWDRIPAFPDLLTVGPTLKISAERAVLHGGEEFALLFTSTERESELSKRLSRPVYAIGRMTEEKGVVLERNGKREALADEGFDHFA
jgi:thiamine-monophosphate kinase